MPRRTSAGRRKADHRFVLKSNVTVTRIELNYCYVHNGLKGPEAHPVIA